MPIHVTTSTTQSLSNKTFVDRLSTTGIVHASGGTSNQWNSAYSHVSTTSGNNSSVYSSVNTASANWNASYTITNSKSASWDSVYSSFNTQSAAYAAVYTNVNSKSANWDSVYSQVYSLSDSWGTGGSPQTLSFNESNALLTISSGNSVSLSALSGSTGSAIDVGVRALTGNWQDTYTQFSTQSANNLSVYSTVQTSSASWADTRSNVLINGSLSANNLILSASQVPYDGITAVNVGNINFGNNINRQNGPVAGGLSDQITLVDRAGASRNVAIGNGGLGEMWFSTYQTGSQGGFSFYNGNNGSTVARIAANGNLTCNAVGSNSGPLSATSNIRFTTANANILDNNNMSLLKVAQVVTVQDATAKSTTVTAPLNDTVPQLSSLSLYNELSAIITPTNSSSTLIIDVLLPIWQGAAVAGTALISLFNSTAGNSFALASVGQSNAASYYVQTRLRYIAPAGSTAQQSFYIAFARVTGSTATVRINDGATPYWGDTQRSTMTITEIRP